MAVCILITLLLLYVMFGNDPHASDGSNRTEGDDFAK
jgi:hypothetical protein